MKMKNEDVLAYIKHTNAMEISGLLDAVIERYHVLYPEWELNVFVLPMAPGAQRQKQFEDIVAFIRKHGGIYWSGKGATTGRPYVPEEQLSAIYPPMGNRGFCVKERAGKIFRIWAKYHLEKRNEKTYNKCRKFAETWDETVFVDPWNAFQSVSGIVKKFFRYFEKISGKVLDK